MELQNIKEIKIKLGSYSHINKFLEHRIHSIYIVFECSIKVIFIHILFGIPKHFKHFGAEGHTVTGSGDIQTHLLPRIIILLWLGSVLLPKLTQRPRVGAAT